MKKITGISYMQQAEGMICAYRYSEVDENGTILSTNNRGSFVDDSAETEDFLAAAEKKILQRIGENDK